MRLFLVINAAALEAITNASVKVPGINSGITETSVSEGLNDGFSVDEGIGDGETECVGVGDGVVCMTGVPMA